MAGPLGARTVEITFLGSTAQLEAALARAGVVAKTTGDAIGDSMDKATDRAGNAFKRLGQWGESWGIPFASSLDKVGTKIEDADTKGQKFTQTMSALGGVTLLAAGAALAGVSAESVKLGLSFQKSMASIAANSDISVKAADRIGQAFLGTAGYMTMSGNEMAAAFAPVAGQLKLTEGHALSAGEALGFMKTAADLAEGSQTDLGSATAALSQVMQSFHLSLGQAASASDLLFNVGRSLNVPIEQVAAAVDKLHGRLGILMPSMSDVGALMVALGQHGIMGSRGIQVAQTALTKLTDGNQATKTVLGELGVSVDNSQGKFVGMANLIDELRPKLADLNQKSQEVALTTLFGSSAWQVMGQIIGAGVPKFEAATEAATKMNTAHRAAENQAHTLDGQIKILVASVEDIATKLGMLLIPALTSFGQALANSIDWMEQHKAVAEALAAVIGTVLGAAVLVFAEQKAVAFGKGIQSMIGDLRSLGTMIDTAVSKLLGLGTTSETTGPKVAAVGDDASTATPEVAGLGTAAETSTGEVAGLGTAAATATPGVSTLGIDATAAGAGELTLGADAATATPEVAALDTAAGGAAVGLASLGASGTVAAAGVTAVALGGDQGPTKQYPIHPPGAAQVTAPTKGESAEAYFKATLGLPPNYKGGPITPSSYKGPGEDTKFVDSFFKWLEGEGSFSASGFVPSAKLKQQQAAVSGKGGRGTSTYDKAAGTAAIPAAVTAMITTAQALIGTQYTWGGGHSGWDPVAELKKIGVDCSGFVSQVLHAGGVQLPGPQTTEGLAANLQKGAGKYVTVYDRATGPMNNQHTIIDLNGQFYESGGSSAFNPAGGVSALTNAQAQGELSGGGFVAYHPTSFGGIPNQGYGTGTEPTGTKSITPPSIQASTQKTVDGINTAFQAAIGKYTSAAQSATSQPLRVIDENTEKAIAALKASFDAQAKGLSGPALESLKTTDSQQLTHLEALNASAVKTETTFEAIHLALTNQEKAYTSAAQSATSQIVAKLDERGEKQVATLLAGFHSTTQDATTKEHLKSIVENTSARVRIGSASAAYTTAAQSATSPLLAQLDEHFAQLLGDYATGAHLPAGGVVGRVEQRARVQTALGGRAQSLIGSSESNLNSLSYQTLASSTDKIQKSAMDQLVKELDATHVSELEKMARQIEQDFHAEEKAKNAILVGDTQQMNAALTAKLVTLATDTSNQTVQAMKDAAQSMSDSLAAAAQAITDASQLASDAATGQATVISDQAQTTVDQLGERGLWGLNLVAQQMKVGADQQKTAFDSQLNVLQQNVDSVTKAQDALVNQAQQHLDNVTSQQNTITQTAQTHLDVVTAQWNAQITAAQGQVNLGVQGSQAQLGKVQGEAASAEETAAQQLSDAQAKAAQMEQVAQTALTQAQGQASVAISSANSTLATAQNAATTAEATTAAAVAVMEEDAATQFAGSGTSIYITGVPLDDAAAVASAVSWVARSQFTSPVAA